MKPNSKEVGQRIRLLRKSLGITLEEFGNRIGDVKRSAVGNWERGDNLPNNERLKKIVDLGNISIEELLYGSVEDFRYAVIKELYEINMIKSGMKEKSNALFRYIGGTNFINEVYEQVARENLGYHDEDKIKQVFKIKYNSRLANYANQKSKEKAKLDKERLNFNLNLIGEYFEREANYKEYQRKVDSGEFISPNLDEKEKLVTVTLDDENLSDEEIQLLQKTIEEIRNNRK